MINTLAAFDLETTSPKPQTCAAVQVGLVCFEYTMVASLRETVVIDEICDPGMDVSDGAAAVHGITPEMMIGKRPDYEVLRDAYVWLKDHDSDMIIIGHNYRGFDIIILNRIVQAIYPELFAARGPVASPFIDTLTVARRVLHMAPNGHKLGDLYQWISGQAPVDAHDAIGDGRMVLTLVQYLCAALKMTVEEMATYCAETRVLEVCTYKKHAGKLWGRGPTATHVPFFYAKWMAENFESPDPDLVATLRAKYNLRFRYA